MVDTACIVHGFSYASPIPDESIQGNAKHALGESISFGRFVTDQSLSWEKWSTFSQKKYVEEAEKYSRPGSVAQKKAFFEDHYKKIAAKKAAALLEQQNAAKTEPEEAGDDNSHEKKTYNSHADIDNKTDDVKIQYSNKDDVMDVYEHSSIENGKDGEDAVKIENDVSRSTKKYRLDGKRSSSRSLRALLGLDPFKEPNRDPISKTESSPKDCSGPSGNPASTKGVSSYKEPSPQSETRRTKVSIDPSAPNGKTETKWRILLALCSKPLSASRNKQQATAGNEASKLSCCFCFKAQPMIDSYKDGETPRNQIEKATAIRPRPAELEKHNSNKMNGSISVPPPPPPPTCPIKNSPSKNLSKK